MAQRRRRKRPLKAVAVTKLRLRDKIWNGETAHLSADGPEQRQFRFHGARMLAPEHKKSAVRAKVRKHT